MSEVFHKGAFFLKYFDQWEIRKIKTGQNEDMMLIYLDNTAHTVGFQEV